MSLLPKPVKRPHGSRWHPETCAPRDLIRKLYLEGNSSRQVAAIVGYSARYVHEICFDITRDRVSAAILRQPQRSKHWRTCRANARKTMERFLGRKLTRHEEVHHRDEDYTNGDISNLEVLESTPHRHLHNPPNPVPRWLRPERRAYMKEYLRNYRRSNGASAEAD